MALAVKKEPYTYRDLDNFPDDDKRREIIGGELFVSAAPSTRHQRLIGELFFLIRLFLQDNPLGTVFMAPTQVVFDEMESVEPDIFVVLKEGQADVTERRVLGAPDWIVEVLSPTNRDYDLETKRKLYARYGVVYWVVDPEAEALISWDAEGKEVYGRGDEAKVSVLPGFGLKISDLFGAVSQCISLPLMVVRSSTLPIGLKRNQLIREHHRRVKPVLLGQVSEVRRGLLEGVNAQKTFFCTAHNVKEPYAVELGIALKSL